MHVPVAPLFAVEDSETAPLTLTVTEKKQSGLKQDDGNGTVASTTVPDVTAAVDTSVVVGGTVENTTRVNDAPALPGPRFLTPTSRLPLMSVLQATTPAVPTIVSGTRSASGATDVVVEVVVVVVTGAA